MKLSVRKSSTESRASHKHLARKESDCSSKVKKLSRSDISELRNAYIEIFQKPSPPAFGPDLLRKSIAHEMQTRTYGGLPSTTDKQLRELINRCGPELNARSGSVRKVNVGSEFARAWKGKMHRVVVAADGYGYGGKTFTSLSEIARLITGTQWNGPRFFGLRGKQKK